MGKQAKHRAVGVYAGARFELWLSNSELLQKKAEPSRNAGPI
jgi:hypothetical protein